MNDRIKRLSRTLRIPVTEIEQGLRVAGLTAIELAASRYREQDAATLYGVICYLEAQAPDDDRDTMLAALRTLHRRIAPVRALRLPEAPHPTQKEILR